MMVIGQVRDPVIGISAQKYNAALCDGGTRLTYYGERSIKAA